MNVVVRQRAPVFQLLAREDEVLLIGRDSLPVLDLGPDGLNVSEGSTSSSLSESEQDRQDTTVEVARASEQALCFGSLQYFRVGKKREEI